MAVSMVRFRSDGGSLLRRRRAEGLTQPREARAVSMGRLRSDGGSLLRRRRAEALAQSHGARA
eukprot:8003216-Alexandrium_andersonii.AAC.1